MVDFVDMVCRYCGSSDVIETKILEGRLEKTKFICTNCGSEL